MRFTFSVFFAFFFIDYSSTPFVHARHRRSRSNIKCVDLADFFYEIILGVTSFPTQGDCSEREEAEIAALLQKGINDELRAIPGTIKTNNKVCSNPINHRRRRLATNTFALPYANQTRALVTTPTIPVVETRLSEIGSMQNERNLLLRMGRRSFIYVGGGRCRYCFYDDFDHRALAASPDLPERDLLYLYTKKPKTPFPKVTDIFLCKDFIPALIFFAEPDYKQHVKWINAKFTSLPNKMRRLGFLTNIAGLYAAGDRFGVQLVDMKKAVHTRNKKLQRYYQKKKIYKNKEMVEQPVKEGKIGFIFWALDMPSDFTNGTLPDDPFYIFINGLKLDFNVLMADPKVKRETKPHWELLSGNSFAGIQWTIIRWTHLPDDFALGPQPDRKYSITITLPLVVLSHKNQLDLDFIIKPKAKAKHYAFSQMNVHFKAAKCEVSGLENSPFEEFQSVVESRLFHRLGMDLAREFQGKEGHCLYDKIPVVNVHLVEKEGRKDSNPTCAVQG